LDTGLPGVTDDRLLPERYRLPGGAGSTEVWIPTTRVRPADGPGPAPVGPGAGRPGALA